MPTKVSGPTFLFWDQMFFGIKLFQEQKFVCKNKICGQYFFDLNFSSNKVLEFKIEFELNWQTRWSLWPKWQTRWPLWPIWPYSPFP